MKRVVVGLFVAVATIVVAGCGNEDLPEIPYTPDFTTLVTEGKVAKVEIIREPSGATYIRGEAKVGQSPDAFRVYVADANHAHQFLVENGVELRIPQQNPGAWQCISSVLPMVLAWVLWLVWIVVIMFVLWLAVRLVRAVERIAKNTEKD